MTKLNDRRAMKNVSAAAVIALFLWLCGIASAGATQKPSPAHKASTTHSAPSHTAPPKSVEAVAPGGRAGRQQEDTAAATGRQQKIGGSHGPNNGRIRRQPWAKDRWRDHGRSRSDCRRHERNKRPWVRAGGSWAAAKGLGATPLNNRSNVGGRTAPGGLMVTRPSADPHPGAALKHVTKSGSAVRTRPNGRVSDVHDARRGMDVHNNMGGGRRVSVQRRDGSRMVAERGRRGLCGARLSLPRPRFWPPGVLLPWP